MGSPKESLSIGGETFLGRVVRIVAKRSSVVVVSAAKGQLIPPLPAGIAVEIVRDSEPDRGPLQGIALGLAALGDRVDWAFACASDSPMIEPAWIDRLLDFEGADIDLILPRIGGRDQPLAALYRPGPAAREASSLLASGQSRLGLLAERLRSRILIEKDFRNTDPAFRTIENINTPQAYRRLIENEFPSADKPRPKGDDEP